MTPHLTVGQPVLTLPDAIVTVLLPFAMLFQDRTWQKAQVLLVGTILTPGQRTVAVALRVMGLSDDRNYARYHHVLNRAAWSPLGVSQVLLRLLIQHLDHGDGPLVVIDLGELAYSSWRFRRSLVHSSWRFTKSPSVNLAGGPSASLGSLSSQARWRRW